MSDNAKNDSNGDTSIDSQNNNNLNDENVQKNELLNSDLNTTLNSALNVEKTTEKTPAQSAANPPPQIPAPHVNVIAMPVGDLMKKNYLNYAVAVIMDRALPDVRDGLKPVHRRILYAMHELKMMPGTAYKKSARMVGECMGKFHPHGDSSIYDASVAMVQPWSKLVPLIDGQGNFGSVDGDNAAAMRYCFAAGTRIMTEKGLIEIEKLVDSSKLQKALSKPGEHSVEELNLSVESLNGALNASKWIYSGGQDTVKVKTTNGYEAVCTPNEPFLILNSDLAYVWKDAGELKVGDKVCMLGQRSQVKIKSAKNISYAHPSQADLGSKARVYDLPSHMSVELATILGAIVSDGCIRPTNNEIIFASSDNDFFNYFIKSFNKVFPDCKDYNIREIQNFESNNETTSFTSKLVCKQFSIASVYLFKFFQNIGYTGWNSYDVAVPRIIFESSHDEVSAFLSAYFEGDGSIYGASTQTTISACSVNKNLLTDIKMLLINYFGIISGKILIDGNQYDSYNAPELKNGQGYRFLITQNSQIELFKRNVGFISNKKQQILNSSYESNKGCPSFYDTIPFIKEYSNQFIDSRKISSRKYLTDSSQTVLDTDICSIIAISKISNSRSKMANTFKNILTPKMQSAWGSFYEKMAEVQSRGYFYATIESITPADNQPVFDLTVPGTHAFCANGFVVHNTEMRLTKAGAAFFEDIDKNTVDFRDNYDGSEREPEVLPVSYPNIWVNGVDGIAVGMATYLPPHNLNETIDLTLALQVNPLITIEEVLKIMPGPDFPTGGIVHELDGFKNAIIMGKGAVRVRSKWHSESVKNAAHELLILDELPYKVNKKTLIEDISDKVRLINKNKDTSNELSDIVDIHDESNKEGIRVVITLRKGAIPAVVFNHLVKKTEVESSYSYNVMLLEGQSPKQMGLIEILKKFLEFRAQVIKRRVAFDLKKAGDRLHLLSGMMTVLAQLTLAVDIIMKNKDSKSANSALVAQFNIDDVQAQAILDMKLQRLTGMEIDYIKEEFAQVTSRVLDMNHILANPARVQEIIKNDLLQAKVRFGQDRLTEVSYENNSIDMMDLIKEEQCLIHVTKNGYLKRMPLDLLEAQKRNGKGRMGIQTSDDDYVEAIYSASSHDQFMIFTKSGKAMASQVWRLPDGTTAQKGRHLRNIFENLSEEVASILILPRVNTGNGNTVNNTTSGEADSDIIEQNSDIDIDTEGDTEGDILDDVIADNSAKDEMCVVTVTAKGKVKRTALSNYRGTMRKNGVQGVGIEDGDSLVSCMLAKTGDELMLVSSNGKAAVFEINNESLQIRGRKSVGVKGMDLGYKNINGTMSEAELDAIAKAEKNLPVIISAMVIPSDEFNSVELGVEKYLLCVGENGVGKRTRVAEFTPHSRGTKGVTCLNINEKTGRIVKSALVTELDDLMMTTSQKTIRIKVVDIKAASRNTAGTMLMNVEGEKLIDVAVVPTQGDDVIDGVDEIIDEIIGVEGSGLDLVQIGDNDNAQANYGSKQTDNDMKAGE